jgi:hypothetical protein
MSASKTPILVLVLLLYLDVRRKRLTIRSLALGASVITIAFTTIQGLKNIRSGVGASRLAEDSSIWVNVYLSLTGRLDGLYSLSGAVLRGPGSFQLTDGLSQTLFTRIVPNWVTGETKTLSGLEWGRQIHRTSSGAYFAEGVPAEGYALYGLLGVAVWAVVAAAMMFATERSLQSGSIFFGLVSLGFVGTTGLFERGVFGQLEILSTCAQVAVLAVLYRMMTRQSKGQDVVLADDRAHGTSGSL